MKIHALNEGGVGSDSTATTRCGIKGRVYWRDEQRLMLTQWAVVRLVKLKRVLGTHALAARRVPAEAPTCKSCLRLYRHELTRKA